MLTGGDEAPTNNTENEISKIIIIENDDIVYENNIDTNEL